MMICIYFFLLEKTVQIPLTGTNINSVIFEKENIMILTAQKSIFCQALAMTSLLEELFNKNFLNSDYYKQNIIFTENNENLQEILKISGLGNPATMQMFLYILLVVLKETLSDLDEETINAWINELNPTIQSFSPFFTLRICIHN